MVGYDRRDPIRRGEGVNEAERYLKQLCERSFLSLWSYPGIYRDQGHGKEVCDMLVVFQDHIVIFSDKDCEFRFKENVTLKQTWRRWFRKAIADSARQTLGAERWIKTNPHRLFLDPAGSQHFPIDLPDLSKAKFHHILVAHGIAGWRKKILGGSGSLLIDPSVKHLLKDKGGDYQEEEFNPPFTIGHFFSDDGEPLDYIHVFDDHSLNIVMRNLDTITDFVNYLMKKERFIQSGQLRFAEGEENLLAYYFQHYNSNHEHDFILPKNETQLTLQGGEWDKFVNSPEYKTRLAVDSESYVWDRLIENFNQHILDGDYYYLSTDPSTIIHAEKIMPEPILRFLAREIRLWRRELARSLVEVIEMTPSTKIRYRFVHPRTVDDPCYVYVVDSHKKGEHMESEVWIRLLEAYALSAKRVHPPSQHIIVIGIEKNTDTGDYYANKAAYVDARSWCKVERGYIQQFLRKFPFLKDLKSSGYIDREYPKTSTQPIRVPIEGIIPKMKGNARNKPCPCGSGKKFKNCCGDW